MSSRTQAGHRILERIVRDEYRGTVQWEAGGKHIFAWVTLPDGTRARLTTSKNSSGDTRKIGAFVRQHIRRAQAQA